MEEWKEYKLGEVVTFKTGKLNSNAAIENGCYPFFTCSPDTLRINEYAFDQKAILLAGNNAEGNFNIKYYEGKFNAYQRTYVINPLDERLNIRFLYYALSVCLQSFKRISQGTSTKFLTAQILNKFILNVPSLPTQQKIASILSSLDDKIEVNRRINEQLEELAQALFKSWFVDFEPFKDGEFVESELGMIPKGWKVYQLSDLVKIIGGYSYKGNELVDSDIAMVTIKNFDRKGGFKIDGYKEIIPSAKLKESQVVTMHDIVVAHTDLTQNADIIGNPAMIMSLGGYKKLVISMDLVKVESTTENISNGFLYCLLKDARFKNHALGYVNGTTVLHLSKKALPDYKLALPVDLEILVEMSNAFDDIFLKEANNYSEIEHLTTLRDTLLPKLMSGEIDVNEV